MPQLVQLDNILNLVVMTARFIVKLAQILKIAQYAKLLLLEMPQTVSAKINFMKHLQMIQ